MKIKINGQILGTVQSEFYTLVKNGIPNKKPMTAYNMGKELGRTSAVAYETLEQLHDKGLIKKKPNTYEYIINEDKK